MVEVTLTEDQIRRVKQVAERYGWEVNEAIVNLVEVGIAAWRFGQALERLADAYARFESKQDKEGEKSHKSGKPGKLSKPDEKASKKHGKRSKKPRH